MIDKWWTNEQNQLAELENTEYGVAYLYAREVEGGWEYAIVGWQYRCPTLRMIFKNGEITESRDDDA
jgi:hypothetical protein